jgi:transposase
MARYKEAPYGFECPYLHKCPHLGISAVYASATLSDIERDEDRNGHALIEAMKEIDALDEENRELSARVAELESRLKQQHRMKFKRNAKPAVPQTAGAPGGNPRKRGAPSGHPAWTRRTPDKVDRTVHVPAPDACPHCAAAGLAPSGGTHVQIQEDIVLRPRTVVTEYVHKTAWCPGCRREVFATADGELRNCAVGPVTQAAAVYLRHEAKLSYRDVRKVFSGLFGMPFVPASAMAFSHRAAERGSRLYEDLRDKVRASDIAHGDETHWRIGGKSAFLWYAGNGRAAFFHADRSRGAEVAVSIFGSAFAGNLVADGYAGYNAVNPKRRQACLAHLKRKAKETAERIALMPERQRDAPSLRFCRALETFFPLCCRVDRRRREGSLSFTAAKAYAPRLKSALAEICLLPLADAEAENLRLRLTDPKRDAPNLFTFLEVAGMPPTNNHAEQSLRLPVIFRKITFGSQSLHGAQALATNLSLITTAKRQGRDPLGLIKTILLRGFDTPLSNLYDPGNLQASDSS